MLNKWKWNIAVVLLISSCLGIDSDKISDIVAFEPNISFPLGKMIMQYEDAGDLPIIPPPVPIPITLSERDTVFFRMEENVAVKERVLFLMLRFDTKNRYPAKMGVELYYWDEHGNDIYITDDPIELDAAIIDADGKVLEEQIDLSDLILSEEQINEISAVTQFVIHVTVVDLLLTQQVIDNIETYSASSAVGIQAHVNLR